jgi:hypothetical protein
VQQPDEAVRFEAMLNLIDQDNSGFLRSPPLEASHKQSRRAGAKAPERNARVVVKRDGSAAE